MGGVEKKWLQNTWTRRLNVRHRAWGRDATKREKDVTCQQVISFLFGFSEAAFHCRQPRWAAV